MSTIDLSGKTAIVTGAAGGLGRAFVNSLASAGAIVIAADLDGDGAAKTAEHADGAVSSSVVDVTNRESCTALAQQADETLGGVDILVNNAAIYGALNRADFEDLAEDEWDRVMDVNVKGIWQMSRAVSPLMRSKQAGSIINVGSATVFSGSPQWMHYVASKGAVIAMTRVMARELGSNNIRVNVLAPGITLTDASQELIDDAKGYGANQAALLRNADVEDITGGMLYLASDLSRYMTGQTLVVDGGKRFI